MSSKRILFIHGNLDVPASFDSLLPLLLPWDMQCIDLEDDFNAWDATIPVTVRTVAERVVKAYNIGPDDLLIGHSMGGWIAAHVKELTGATVIQLSSWTDPRKVRAPIRQLGLIRAIVSSGVAQHPACISMAKRLYPFRQSRARIHAALDRVQRMNPAYMIWQYELIFSTVPPLTILPDLRIHDRHDMVIRFPDEPFINVPGNHKIHATNAAGVAEAIRGFLGM
ncbi:alpha/beta fold hydrolase [Fibrella forsythiae]|uniref:Alpha/beta hydrolase n=1 Tax=Fibrella forsythiae TaxID=2817061 RepID=A0ABS3JQQ0_9BACT|nr:alpha/beta hydrolase [Fibrella forsythiae]MBO0952344.1 alpha/beta hydrolase [Fibrella forsythiae]